MMENLRGKPAPLGVSETKEGVNFALYTSKKGMLYLHLFSLDLSPLRTFSLQQNLNLTGEVWHIEVKGLPENFLYYWSIDGSAPLLDPYAREIFSKGSFGNREEPYRPYGLVRRNTQFDWQGTLPPKIPLQDLILYEMHLRGMTKMADTESAGSYLALIEKIPYLKALGINAVELLPIYEFNECEGARSLIKGRRTLLNYWGYSPISFFAPMGRFASENLPGRASDELKLLVRELHRNGIEVILDVVYNHTGEGNEFGPTYSFKGLAPETYYLIDSTSNYLNFSGCGNSLNCNNPIVTELILASLRHWVSEYKIDGFRFDLASLMTRGKGGKPLPSPPIIEAINRDPVLKGVKLIAEPWDPGGLYHVGNFPLHETIWSEWNGQYRDAVRRFIRGDAHTKGVFATRISGSQDLYQNGRSPSHSINFVTCHDGFTLRDLVSYSRKHNEANGEDNHDGSNDNLSANYGVEGKTDNLKIQEVRRRQEKNFLLTLFVSLGTPMLRMGDEREKTQDGNNNSYCHDTPLSWIDWSEEGEILRFTQLLSKFRSEEPFLRRNLFLKPEDVDWHGSELKKPNWGQDEGILAYHLKKAGLYVAFNASRGKRLFTLPQAPDGKNWRVVADTAKRAPGDIFAKGERPLVLGNAYEVDAHSALLLKLV